MNLLCELLFQFELRFARIKVFDQNSRNENYILLPEEQLGHNDISKVAEKFLNEIVYIGWPHMVKGIVVAVSSKEKYIDQEGAKEMDKKTFQLQTSSAKEQ